MEGRTMRMIWPKNSDTLEVLEEFEIEVNSPILHLNTLRTFEYTDPTFYNHICDPQLQTK